MSTGRTAAEAEAPILWPPDAKSWLIRKDLDAGKNCRQILYQLSHKGSPKKAECQNIDAFELWCQRGLSRVRWTVRSSDQSIIKEINSEYSLEGLMLKLKPPDAKS